MLTFDNNFRPVYGIKEPLGKVYARMASLDNISFLRLAESYDVREGLKARGYKPYTSSDKVARYV